MKTLYLLRHAKAASDSPTFEDRDRALNERGKKDAAAVAQAMKARDYIPDIILCSSARRTQETCRLVQETIEPDVLVRYDAGLYLATDREILEAVQGLEEEFRSALVIGHNPGLEELAMQLARKGGPPKFPTAALAVFEFGLEMWRDVAPRRGTYTDYLTPKMLAD